MKKLTIQQLIKQDITKVSQSIIKTAIADVVKQNKALKEEIRSTVARLKKIEKALERANIELNPQPKEKKVVPPEKLRITPKSIKKLMEKLNLNQASLSRLLGITPQTISHWMNGRAQPSQAMKVKIATLRGKTAAQISAAIDAVSKKEPKATSQPQEPAQQSE